MRKLFTTITTLIRRHAKILIICLSIPAILITAVYFYKRINYTPLIAKYEWLKQPVIVDKEPQEMLICKIGPDYKRKILSPMALLYNWHFRYTYRYKIHGLYPRYRKENNITYMGLPCRGLLDPVNPKMIKDSIYFDVWEYGPTAEILYIDGEQTQDKALQTLTQYITKEGYEINGTIETEYLFENNPIELPFIRRYRNSFHIIRIPVIKIINNTAD